MPTRTKTLAALVAALSALAISAAQAAGADDAQKLYTRSVAATCANCHGTDGRAQDDATVSGLAGMSADYIASQMDAFRKGERQGTIMHQIAKGFNEAQTRQLAEYFASQQR